MIPPQAVDGGLPVRVDAGLCVFDIYGLSAELHARLRERYAAFLPLAWTALHHPLTLVAEGAPQVLGGRLALRGRRAGDTLEIFDAVRSWATLNLATGHGHIIPHRSLAALDVLLRAVLTVRALEAGGCTLHAAAVALGENAHIFSGPSGAGKSTVAQALEQEGAHILTDEFCVLIPDAADVWWAHATPFWLGRPGRARVAGLWRLGRGATQITRLTAPETLAHLARNLSLMLDGGAFVQDSLRGVAALAQAAPGFELCYPLGQPIRSKLEEVAP